MKICSFDLMPDRFLPDDFETRYRSVWVDANAYGLMPSPNFMAATLTRRTSRALHEAPEAAADAGADLLGP